MRKQIYNRVEALNNFPVEEVLQNIKILIADDSVDTLDLFKYQMEGMGWSGVYVTSGTQLMEAINTYCDPSGCFDMIVSDVNFFGNYSVTGITAVREIRKVYPNIPVIFITAYANSIIREEIRRVNGELVTKPFQLDDMFVKMSQMLYDQRVGMVDTGKSLSNIQIKTSPIIESALKEARSGGK